MVNHLNKVKKQLENIIPFLKTYNTNDNYDSMKNIINLPLNFKTILDNTENPFKNIKNIIKETEQAIIEELKKENEKFEKFELKFSKKNNLKNKKLKEFGDLQSQVSEDEHTMNLSNSKKEEIEKIIKDINKLEESKKEINDKFNKIKKNKINFKEHLIDFFLLDYQVNFILIIIMERKYWTNFYMKNILIMNL